MNVCFCLTWMQTVHTESSFVYLSIGVFISVGFIWASHGCHILHSEIVRECRVDMVLAAIGNFDDFIVGLIIG